MISPWQPHGFVEIKGKSLEYGCIGPSPDTAPTLVLLHEGLGCLALWRDFPQKLADETGYGILVYSRAGYGQSDNADLPRPLDYMSREATDVLPDLLNSFALRNAVLVGHSDGASISAVYAGTMDDPSIKGAVLMAPHFFTEPMGLASIEEAKDVFDTQDLKAKLGKYHKDPENCFRGWNDSWLHPDFKAWTITDVLDAMPVPILAIQGSDDQYGTLAQIDVITERSPSPVDTLVLDDCRHSPFLDRPDAVLNAIKAFLQTTMPQDGRG